MRRRWVALTAAVYLVTSLPYLSGYLRQTGERRFTGVVFDVVDTAQYFAWMRAFSHRPWIANPLTPDHGAERFFNLQWWLLGLISRGSPTGAIIVYQGLRLVALLAFAWLLARFCSRVAPRHPLLPFALVMLSSGFGWMLVIAKQWTGELRWPLAVQIAEPNVWFSAMAFPHLLVASGLMLWIYLQFLRATEQASIVSRFNRLPARPSWRSLAVLAGLTLALGFSHGYDLLPVIVVPGVFTAARWLAGRRPLSSVWPYGAILAGGALPALYTLSLTTLDATWKGVLSQYGNAGVYTPPPHQLLILIGLPLLLALPRLRPSQWRGASDSGLFVRCWACAGFSLLYIPTDYQVKMLTGWQIPLCLLAGETLVTAAGSVELRLPRIATHRAWRFAPAAILAFAFLTNAYLTAWRVVDLRRAEYPYFLASSDVTALESLDQEQHIGRVVLSSPDLGVWVPVYSDNRPFVAHWAQTLRFLERRDDAAWFFGPVASDQARAQFLGEQGIAWVIAGPAEAALGGTSNPPSLALQRVVDGATSVYVSQNEQAGH